MMEKEFIPYEIALKLKELGFNGDCFAIWSGFDEINFSTTDKVRLYSSKFRINDTQSATFYINDFNSLSSRVSAPTFSQAFRWIKDKYGYFQLFDYQHGDSKINKGFFFNIINTNNEDFFFPSDFEYVIYKTYEEAELECLKKLIEIVNNGNI